MSPERLLARSRVRPVSIPDIVGWLNAEMHRANRRYQQSQAGLKDLGLLDWGRRYLPDHFARTPSAMHRWLADQFACMQQRRAVRINVLGPRGGAKSTLGSLAYPLRAALEGWEPYIWIVSDTRHQACAHLENIKAELVDNPRLAADYPESIGRGPVWRSGSIVLRNGSAIEAFGTGQRLRGRRRRAHRPTLIVCDDLQNDGHILSTAQRDRSRTWFQGTLLKAGTARTNFVNLATALHREALAMELLENPGWTSQVFRSIVHWPRDMALWQEWEALYTDVKNPDYRSAARAFYDAHCEALSEGAEVLWPEEEDLYALMCMRAEGGRTAFEREKQNSPLNPDLCEWPETYFHDEIWFDTWPANLRMKTLALDPSKGSDSLRGDYSAFVLMGVDRDGILYVEADLARRPTPQIVADGVQWWRKFDPDAFGVETNQFQDLLAADFADEFQRQGVLAGGVWPLDNRVNKQVRIRRLGPYLASRRLRFKSDSSGTRLLVEQLKEFPVGDHDDGPDALEMAIRLAADCLNQSLVNDGLGSRLAVG